MKIALVLVQALWLSLIIAGAFVLAQRSSQFLAYNEDADINLTGGKNHGKS